MTAPKPPGPYLDELDARIAEAEGWRNKPEAEFARWQKRHVERQAASRRRREERRR